MNILFRRIGIISGRVKTPGGNDSLFWERLSPVGRCFDDGEYTEALKALDAMKGLEVGHEDHNQTIALLTALALVNQGICQAEQTLRMGRFEPSEDRFETATPFK